MKWLFLLLRLGRFIADTFSTFSPSRLVPSVGLFHRESRNLQLLSYLLAGTWRDLLVPDIRRSDCAHSVVWTRNLRWNDQMSNVFWADCRPARMFLPTAGTALNGLRWRIRIVPLERGFHPRLHALNAFQWITAAIGSSSRRRDEFLTFLTNKTLHSSSQLSNLFFLKMSPTTVEYLKLSRILKIK